MQSSNCVVYYYDSKRCHNSFFQPQERDVSQTAPFCTKISGKQVLVSTFAGKPSPTSTELGFAVFQLVFVRACCQAEQRECWKNWSVAGGGGRAQLRLRVAYSCPPEPKRFLLGYRSRYFTYSKSLSVPWQQQKTRSQSDKIFLKKNSKNLKK